MTYTKTVWTDRQVTTPMRFSQALVSGTTYDLTPVEGAIVQSGTPLTAANMNNIENGIATLDTNKAETSIAQMYKLTADTGILLTASVDIDTIYTSGFYYIGSTAQAASPNLPAATNLTMVVYQFSSTTAMQICYEMQKLNPRSWFRYSSAASWGAWKQVATTDLAQMSKLTLDTGYTKDISSTDLNTQLTSGFYYGQNLTNAPEGTLYHRITNMFTSATSGIQEATTNAGNVYIRTMTGGVWGSWVTQLNGNDPTWFNITPNTGVTVYTGNVAKYCKVGDMVFIRAAFGNIATNSTNVFTLPVGFRPSASLAVLMPGSVSNGVATMMRWTIASTGVVTLEYPDNSAVLGNFYFPFNLSFIAEQ
jgi:hypothetical protein